MRKIDSLKKGIRLFILASFFIFTPEPSSAQDDGNLDLIIEKYSKQYSVDKDLVKSLIQVSSGGNQRAVSQSGAIGLMQLNPSVIKSLGIRNPYDAGENIRGGCNYLKSLLNQFGSMELAVAAFNAGPGEVQKYGKVPPFAETKKFVDAVMKKYKTLKEESPESEVFGSWVGTGRYTKYESKPPLQIQIVGTTQPFDLQIHADGSEVIVKTSKGVMGYPSLYKNLRVERNRFHVEYSGPNPWAVPIPNATMTHTMSYVLDVNTKDGVMKGEFSSTVTSKVVYNIPDLKLPEGSAEINFTMVLNLRKK